MEVPGRNLNAKFCYFCSVYSWLTYASRKENKPIKILLTYYIYYLPYMFLTLYESQVCIFQCPYVRVRLSAQITNNGAPWGLVGH